MNPKFIEIIKEKIAYQFEIETVDNRVFIVFPAKSLDFGDVDICEESLGEYIVTVGNFSHSHFDRYDGSDDERVVSAAEDVASFLKNLFSDRIICFGSHECGGGYYFNDIGDIHELADERDDLFVWSGIFRKAQPI